VTTYTLTDDQRTQAVAALRDRRFETERYVRSTSYEPCAPGCEHCAPKVAHFAALRADLERRHEAIIAALVALDAGPCTCGDPTRKGLHWPGDHK
jgi:hypothetical protein